MPRSTKYIKKRVFRGNQHVRNQSIHIFNQNCVENKKGSASEKKLQQNVDFNDLENELDEDNYNIIINFKVLKTMFNDCICTECCSNDGKLLLKNNLQNKNGFSYELQLSCDTYEYISKYDTSLQSYKKILTSPGKPVAAVNFNAIVP